MSESIRCPLIVVLFRDWRVLQPRFSGVSQPSWFKTNRTLNRRGVYFHIEYFVSVIESIERFVGRRVSPLNDDSVSSGSSDTGSSRVDPLVTIGIYGVTSNLGGKWLYFEGVVDRSAI